MAQRNALEQTRYVLLEATVKPRSLPGKLCAVQVLWVGLLVVGYIWGEGGGIHGSGEIPETERHIYSEMGDRVKPSHPPTHPASQTQDMWFCVNQLISEFVTLMSLYERKHLVLFSWWISI